MLNQLVGIWIKPEGYNVFPSCFVGSINSFHAMLISHVGIIETLVLNEKTGSPESTVLQTNKINGLMDKMSQKCSINFQFLVACIN